MRRNFPIPVPSFPLWFPSLILRPTSSSALWYFSCRALDATTARIAALAALSSVLAAPAMKDRRGRGWGLFFSYPSTIILYSDILFMLFIVIYLSFYSSYQLLFGHNFLPILHKSHNTSLYVVISRAHVCREMFADENPSSSCRNYRGKSGEGGIVQPTVFSRDSAAQLATAKACEKADRRSLSKLNSAHVCIISHSLVPALTLTHSLSARVGEYLRHSI